MDNKKKNFFNGRYGRDELGVFMFFISLFLIVLATVTRISLFYSIGVVTLVFENFRVFSKNIPVRRKENEQFLKLVSPVTNKISIWRRNFRDRKVYKYLKCPYCGTTLRVPRGKGKIKVRCKKCGTIFEARS